MAAAGEKDAGIALSGSLTVAKRLEECGDVAGRLREDARGVELAAGGVSGDENLQLSGRQRQLLDGRPLLSILDSNDLGTAGVGCVSTRGINAVCWLFNYPIPHRIGVGIG